MKKRAYLAVLALCLAMTGVACGPETIAPGNDSSGGEKTETVEPTPSYTQGFGTRLVSVDNVEKYIKLAEYKGLVLDKNAYQVTDEQVEEQVIFNLLSDRKEVTSSKGRVEEGDLVTLNYIGTINGKILENEDTYDLIVGEGSMVAGFEENLIGMKKGETKRFSITFPEDFSVSELAGKRVSYRVTLQSFQREPELTDELAAANAEVSTLDEYRQMIREELEAEAETASQEALRNAAWDIVLMNSEMKDFPQADIDNAIDEFKKQVMAYSSGSDMDLETFVKSQGMTMDAFEGQCRQYAESKVKQNLIVQGIMDAEGISLEDNASLAVQDQLIIDFQAASLAQLLDTYGQSMIDEAIGLIRVEDFLVENAVFEEPLPEAVGEVSTEETTLDSKEEA